MYMGAASIPFNISMVYTLGKFDLIGSVSSLVDDRFSSSDYLHY